MMKASAAHSEFQPSNTLDSVQGAGEHAAR